MASGLTKFGLGFRPVHSEEILGSPPQSIDWFEVVSENFMAVGGRPRRNLEKLRAHYPVALHGVGLSIAGPDSLDTKYLEALKALADQVNPFIISDHLCWTSFQRRQSHDLLPFPFDDQTLDYVAARVSYVQDFLRQSILLENPTAYVDSKSSTLSEAKFLEELCRRTGCRVLLDLNNIFVNQCNLGWDPQDYFNELALDHVQQFHLAGHSTYDDIRIDTHSQAVPEEVWDLYRLAVRRWPHALPMIEWDDQIPPVATLIAQVAKARSIHTEVWDDAKVSPVNVSPVNISPVRGTRQPDSNVGPPSPLQTQDPGRVPQMAAPESLKSHAELIFSMLSRPQGVPPAGGSLFHDRNASAMRGLTVYNQGYYLRIRDAMGDTFPTLTFLLEDSFDDVVALYLQYHLKRAQPHHWSIDRAGWELGSFLNENRLPFDCGAPQSILADIAAIEAAAAELWIANEPCPPLRVQKLAAMAQEHWEQFRPQFRNTVHILELSSNPLPVIAAAKEDELAEIPAIEEGCRIAVHRTSGDVRYRTVGDEESKLLTALRRVPFGEAVATFSETEIQQAAHIIYRWTEEHWLADHTVDPNF